jgi:cation diffusion facilitator CzcD-associated flavoprotein CzcO
MADLIRPAESGDVAAVVVGAGQAGLSGSYFLRRFGVPHVVLDADPGPGGAWQHRWPTLRFDRVHGLHPLPGSDVPPADPARPASEVVAEYYGAYERELGIPVRRPVRVRAVRSLPDGRLAVEGDAGTWTARALVNATGTWRKPFWPRYPGMATFAGRQLHTADYRGPRELAGAHVVVVGGGSSAVQLLAEISAVATTTWVTRRPPVWLEPPWTEDVGRRAVALVEQRVGAGRPPASVVSVTGLGQTPDVAAARDRGVLQRHEMFARIVPDGVLWADGRFVRADVILWATGFLAAPDHLAPLRLRERGGGIRLDGTRVVKDPRVHLVGYGPSASTIGANRAGRAAAREVAALLRDRTAQPVVA